MASKKHLFYLFGLLFVQLPFAKAQTIEVSGNISENTLWNADTVKLVGDVAVDSGVTLTISPGVYVEAQGYYKLAIEGNIIAEGERGDTIIFSVNDTTGFWSDTTSVTGGWHGIYITGQEGSADSSSFRYCKFQYGKNYDKYGGDINGGVLYVKNHAYLHLNHCLFSDNMVICYVDGAGGPFGGALYCESVSSVIIDSNLFVKNRSFNEGGALRIGQQCNEMTITHNVFIRNTAFFYREIDPPWNYVIGGGGAAISTSDLTYSPDISDNYCFNNKGLNGIIYTSNPNGLIYNNVICNNWGCGIMDGHSASITRTFNNTIVNNKSHYGGIIVFSPERIYNNICWGNVYYPWQETDQIDVEQNYPVLSYNCVQYGDGGEGAVYDIPEFVDPTEGIGLSYDGAAADWSLEEFSPCINTGTPDTSELEIPDADVAGNIRIYGNRIDIGAYENQTVWVDIDETADEENIFRIFPNPASAKLTLFLKDPVKPEECLWQFYDSYGRLFKQKETVNTGQFVTIDVSSWPNGLYIVTLQNNTGTFIRKFIKN